MKQHLFYTLLAVFAATALLTLLAVAGVIKIEPDDRKNLLIALLLETAAAVVALYRKTDFFADTEERTQIRELAKIKSEGEKELGRRIQELEVVRIQAKTKEVALMNKLHEKDEEIKVLATQVAEMTNKESAKEMFERCVAEYRAGKIPIKAIIDAKAYELNTNEDLMRLLEDLERFGFPNPFKIGHLETVAKEDWLKYARIIWNSNLRFTSQEAFDDSFLKAALFGKY